LRVYLPLFAPAGANGAGTVAFGELQPGNVRAMSDWMLANHLIDVRVAPRRYGTNEFLPHP
jgi:hypothetical protein